MIDHKKLLKELINKLEKQFKDNFTGLILFGSYAKGTAKEYSDLDIILTFKKLPKSRIERLELIEDLLNDLEDKYKLPINPIISKENHLGRTFLLADICDYAKILLDKNKKITNKFEELKNEYKLGTIQKLIVGNHYMLKLKNV